MNIFLIIGLIVGLGGVIFGYIEDGGVLSALLKPSAASIVFGGTIGFVLLSFPLSFLKQIPGAFKLILFYKKRDFAGVIDQLVALATIARKEGILALEAESQNIQDPFLKKGITYVTDGVEPSYLKTVLEFEIEAKNNEYESAAKVLEGAGGAAPSMGVLGTVMGMVSILRDMSVDMSELGHKIATAFIATMYGVGSANLLWLPLGGHVKNCAQKETEYYELIIEGLLCILQGEYPAKMKDILVAKAGKIEGKKKSVEVKEDDNDELDAPKEKKAGKEKAKK